MKFKLFCLVVVWTQGLFLLLNNPTALSRVLGVLIWSFYISLSLPEIVQTNKRARDALGVGK